MHDDFRRYVEALHPSFERLSLMPPTKVGLLCQPLPDCCVYLFSEGDQHLYVGRTRRFRQRMRQHTIDSSTHNAAVFAFKLTREVTGKTVASYSQAGSRTDLLDDPEFAEQFLLAKRRVREMDLRYVEESDPTRQALLEIYVSVALRTPYNDFNTH